jgi:hypothetical protein
MTTQPVAIRHRSGCSEPPPEDVYVVSLGDGRAHVEQRCPACGAVAKALPSWYADKRS